MVQHRQTPKEFQNTQTSHGEYIVWTSTAKLSDEAGFVVTEICLYKGGFLEREDVDLSVTEVGNGKTYSTREEAAAAALKVGKDHIESKQANP